MKNIKITVKSGEESPPDTEEEWDQQSVEIEEIISPTDNVSHQSTTFPFPADYKISDTSSDIQDSLTYADSRGTRESSRQDYQPSQQDYQPCQQDYQPSQQDYQPSQQDNQPSQQVEGNHPSRTDYQLSQKDYNSSQQDYNPSQQDYNPSQQDYITSHQEYKQIETFPYAVSHPREDDYSPFPKVDSGKITKPSQPLSLDYPTFKRIEPLEKTWDEVSFPPIQPLPGTLGCPPSPIKVDSSQAAQWVSIPIQRL